MFSLYILVSLSYIHFFIFNIRRNFFFYFLFYLYLTLLRNSSYGKEKKTFFVITLKEILFFNIRKTSFELIVIIGINRYSLNI